MAGNGAKAALPSGVGGRLTDLYRAPAPGEGESERTTLEGASAAHALSHRSALYGRYATLMQGSEATTSTRDASKNPRLVEYHLRGWLPKHKDVSILDAGCGAGAFLLVLQAMGYTNAIGVDISPEQLDRARAAGANVVEGDVLAFLRTNAAAFDLIVGVDIIEHLTKAEALEFLDLCRNALRGGAPHPPDPQRRFAVGRRGALRRFHPRGLLHAGSADQALAPRRLYGLRGARVRSGALGLQPPLIDPVRRLASNSGGMHGLEPDRDRRHRRRYLQPGVLGERQQVPVAAMPSVSSRTDR